MISRKLSFVIMTMLMAISLMFGGVEKQIAKASTLTPASKYTLSIDGKKLMLMFKSSKEGATSH